MELLKFEKGRKGVVGMKLLEERIRRDGIIEAGEVLKVDSFLNHQMDVQLYREMGREWRRLFDGAEITKILTIEASGIGIACVAALEFGVPVIFAKKSKTKNIAGEVYSTTVTSFTHGNVSRAHSSVLLSHPTPSCRNISSATKVIMALGMASAANKVGSQGISYQGGFYTQYERAMSTRYLAGLPVTISTPGVCSKAKGTQRMVACVSSLMRASVSGVPSQWQRKKPPSFTRSLNSS